MAGKKKSPTDRDLIYEPEESENNSIGSNKKRQKGTVLIRYGSDNGNFTAPYGTRFDQLALPYLQNTVEFHKYRVLKDTPVTCIEVLDEDEQLRLSDLFAGPAKADMDHAVEGLTAPAFGLPGGAVQYYHDAKIKDMPGITLEAVE